MELCQEQKTKMEVWVSVCRTFMREDFAETLEVFATKEEAVAFNNDGIDKLREYWEQIGPIHDVREEKIKKGEVVSDINPEEGYACFYKQGYYYEDCDECFVQKKIVK